MVLVLIRYDINNFERKYLSAVSHAMMDESKTWIEVKRVL